MPLHFLLFVLFGCTTATTGFAPPCVPDAPVPDVAEAAAGDVVHLATHPIAETYDTAVTIGGLDAEVLGVSRVGCEAFDSCVESNGCSSCGDCDACGASGVDCEETVRVRVPALTPGRYGVVVYSKYGASMPGELVVTDPDGE